MTLPELPDFNTLVDFPVPELKAIPAGPFLLGSNTHRDSSARKQEMPQVRMLLPGYWMGRYPVTVAQFRAFVESDGYADARWWSAAGWTWLQNWKQQPQPQYWDNPRYTTDPRLPVIGVSWYEAWAYTRWLTGTLRAAEAALPEGYAFRLPSEAEWEKAARGTRGRLYPWGDLFRDVDSGDVRCNTVEARIHALTPVDAYSPTGDSPFGCADMVGNVREWCLTRAGVVEDAHWQDSTFLFWQYDMVLTDADHTPEGKSPRVLRGGGWQEDQVAARCANREAEYPNMAEDTIGFRLCLAPPATDAIPATSEGEWGTDNGNDEG